MMAYVDEADDAERTEALLWAAPTGPLPAPPIDTKPQVLPIGDLYWPDAERLFLRLLHTVRPVQYATLFGVPGQAQAGIDAYARLPLDLTHGDTGGRHYITLQSRRVKSLTAARIKEAVDDLLKGEWAGKAAVFHFATSFDLQDTKLDDAIREQTERLAKLGITYVPWGVQEVSTLLKDQARIVDDFFGRPWVERFCGPEAAQALANNLPHQDSRDLRAGLGDLYRSGVPADVRAGRVEPTVDAAVRVGGSRWPPPRQLPSGPPRLVGRRAEIAQLDRYHQEQDAAGQSSLIVISGGAGVGKTALAISWLQKNRDRFPDGQLYINLEPRGPDMQFDLGKVLSRLLRGLGVPAERIPVDVAELCNMYRSVTAEQALVVMVDNANSSDQVVPLLPAHPGLMVVTSRQRLDGLIGYQCHWMRLSRLSRSASIDLLGVLVGADRVGQEPVEVQELVELCDRLPLALCIVAALIRRRPHSRIAGRVAELRDERQRIRKLAVDDSLSLVAPLNLSFRGLRAKARRLYCALGLHPGPDFPAELATTLAADSQTTPGRLLDTLVDASLLDEPTEGRYAFPDLIRLHARQKTKRRGAKVPSGTVESRIVEWYLWMARSADRVLTPYRTPPTYHFQDRPAGQVAMIDRQQALRWFDAERRNLMAVARLASAKGMAEATWHVCDAMWSLFLYRRRYADRLEIDQLGVANARAWGNQIAEADMLKRLGQLHGLIGEFDRAIELLQEAIELSSRCGATGGEADARADLGRVHLDRGAIDQAQELLVHALQIHQERGDDRSVALILINHGLIELKLRDHDRAIRELEQALVILERHREKDPYNHARALIALGRALVHVGQHARARGYLVDGLEIMNQYQSQYHVAEVSVLLGEIAEQAGDRDGALRHYKAALQPDLALGDHETRRLEQRIAALTEGRSA